MRKPKTNCIHCGILLNKDKLKNVLLFVQIVTEKYIMAA